MEVKSNIIHEMERTELLDILKNTPGAMDFKTGRSNTLSLQFDFARFKLIREPDETVTIKWESFIVKDNGEEQEINDLISLLAEFSF